MAPGENLRKVCEQWGWSQPRSRLLGRHNDNAGVFRELYGGVKGAHQAVFDDAGDGQWAAGAPGKVGFHGLRRHVAGQVKRREPRLGRDLFISLSALGASLITKRPGHRCFPSICSDDENGRVFQLIEDVGNLVIRPIIALVAQSRE